MGCASRPEAPEAALERRAPRHLEEARPRALVHAMDYRARFGHAELFIPRTFQRDDRGWDLVVHFHGMGRLQEASSAEANLNAVVVSYNAGVGTGSYASAFAPPHSFERLLAKAEELAQESGLVGRAPPTRLALTAWSAGFASVSHVMRHRSVRDRVDAVLLADGLFTSYLDRKKRTVNGEALRHIVEFAREATEGRKLFGLTHSSIPTVGYPSVGEATDFLLSELALEKQELREANGHGMTATYRCEKGAFFARGFEGKRAADHILHVKAMGETLFPRLTDRWRA